MAKARKTRLQMVQILLHYIVFTACQRSQMQLTAIKEGNMFKNPVNIFHFNVDL